MDASHLFAAYGGGPSLIRTIMKHDAESVSYLIMRVPQALAYLDEYGAFPILKFTENDSDYEYFKMTFSDPLGGPMGVSVIGEEIVIFGKSRRWAIYAQRPFVEVAMVVTNFNPDLLVLSNTFGWLSQSQVRERLPSTTKILH
jgi:hypothetical protein